MPSPKIWYTKGMVRILFTSDLHGYLGTLPRLTALIERERKQAGHCLLLDAGDMFAPGAALDTQLLAFQRLNYDAVVPGNGETGNPDTAHRMAQLGSPIVAANAKNLRRLPDVNSHIIRKFDDFRIGIVGLTVPGPAGPYHRNGAYGNNASAIFDPVDVAMELIPTLRKVVDFILVLSHLGTDADGKLASAVGGIDLIVGGHSHHCTNVPIVVGDTTIVQPGPQGAQLGVADINEHCARPGCVSATYMQPVWQEIEPDKAAVSAVRRHFHQVFDRPDEVIGHTPGCWDDPWRENPWSNLIVDGIRRDTGAEVSIIKAMMVFPVQDAGAFRWYDVDRCVPALEWLEEEGLDKLVTLSVPGRDLRSVFEHAVSNLAWSAEDDISDSRGCRPCNTIIQVSNASIRYEMSRSRGHRCVQIEVAGEPLQDKRSYTVGTLQFLAKGLSGFTWLGEAAVLDSHHGVRDSIIRTIRAVSERSMDLPPIEGRLRFEDDLIF